MRSFSATFSGVTLVQSLLPGVHAGATLRYVRGTVRRGRGTLAATPGDLLDEGDQLDGGTAENQFDLDAGVLGVAGRLRVGAVIRNLRAPSFGNGAFRLPRQARVGMAVNINEGGTHQLVVAVDADARAYGTTTGKRRVVAAGVEQWLGGQRIALRGGARFNVIGAEERAAAAGASVAVRPGLFVEGQVTRGGADAERGWSVGTRVTF